MKDLVQSYLNESMKLFFYSTSTCIGYVLSIRLAQCASVWIKTLLSIRRFFPYAYVLNFSSASNSIFKGKFLPVGDSMEFPLLVHFFFHSYKWIHKNLITQTSMRALFRNIHLNPAFNTYALEYLVSTIEIESKLVHKWW